MDIKLTCAHQYHLFYEFFSDNEFFSDIQCEACGLNLSQPIYKCLRCKIRMHQSCLKELHGHQLPQEISHPLHPQQHLKLWLEPSSFICNKCSYISSGYRYNDRSLLFNFNLDLMCAASLDEDRLYSEEEFKEETIVHYAHMHPLIIFKYRKVNESDCNCIGCGKRLSDSQLCLGCIGCKFFLHEACSEKIPRAIYHPFHPSHLLRLHRTWNSNNYCSACGVPFLFNSQSYWCHRCNFRLDFHCAKLSPTLKHNRHKHLLTCFGNIRGLSEFCCNVCNQLVWDNFYRCVQCRLTFHLECLPIPSLAKHAYHIHPLIFTNSLKEDDSDEYYCDICEDERNPMEPLYYCKDCKYIAHIHCVLNKNKISFQSKQTLSVDEVELSGENDNIDRQLRLNDPFLHEHSMRFCYAEDEEFNENTYCHACRLELTGPSYICSSCPEPYFEPRQLGRAPKKGFYLHEKCTQLPYQIQHSFHSIHPLHLYTTYRPDIGIVRCDECGDISFGFIYLCGRCNFTLDIKCAALTARETHGGLQQKQMEIVTKFHPHKLLLGNSNDPIIPTKCSVCELSASGPIYFCPSSGCDFEYVHESCLQLPQKLQLPFHDPEHTLVLRFFSNVDSMRCYACPSFISHRGLKYSCEQCHHFTLHSICGIECANSSRRPLKCDSHVHNLYYFGTNSQLLSKSYRNRTWDGRHIICVKCRGICSEPFYRCLQSRCEINFHLECIPLPFIIKSRCHIHHLTLKESFVEDDSGEDYCDVCEEERRSNDHIYCCEECNDLFVAHIECVLAKVEKGLSYKQKPQNEKELEIPQIPSSPVLVSYTGDESPIDLSAQEEEEDSITRDEEEREDSTVQEEQEEDSTTLDEEEREDSIVQDEEEEGSTTIDEEEREDSTVQEEEEEEEDGST